MEILYEDEYLVIADKPYGVLSEDKGACSAPAVLREATGSDIYPVHRLDRTTRGLIVYAKTPQSASVLSKMFSDRKAQKTYLAVCEGIPESDEGELNDLLFYDRSRNKSYVVSRERKGVKEARLSYRKLATAAYDGKPVSLLKIRLHTGRTHQIRVQLSSRKMPLVGDRRYGSTVRADNIALCASELRFTHPITGEEMHFSVSPDGEAFDNFNA